MKVQIFINRHLAKIAVGYHLYYSPEEKINSKYKFKKVVANYIFGYGESCQDGHELELKENEQQSEGIIKRYYY